MARDALQSKDGNEGNPAGVKKAKNRAESFQQLVNYCEGTNKCRHAFINEFFAGEQPPVCDFACDWCKDAGALKRRKRDGLASEEWVSTQRERGEFDEGDGCH